MIGGFCHHVLDQHLRGVLVLWPPTLHLPEFLRGQDRGENPKCAEREKSPDEKQASLRSNPVIHVKNRHASRDDSTEEHDQISRSPLAKQKSSNQVNEENRNSREIRA